MITTLPRVFILIFIALILGCSKPAIEGQVVDDLDVPVADATIKIKNSSLSATTNSTGEYSISFIPGEIELMFSKTGYVSSSLSLNILEKTKYPAEKIVMYKIPTITLKKPVDSSESIRGKQFTIEGKTDRPADVLLNGKKIQLDKENSFNLKVYLGFGENQFKVTARPVNYSESTSLNFSIIREHFPAENEYYKAAKHMTIHSGGLDDFAIDENNNYLVTVVGHYLPQLYDLKSNKLIKKLPKLERDSGYRQAVIFSPDNNSLLVGNYYNGVIGVYNAKDWNMIKTSYVRDAGGMLATCKRKNIILSSSNGIWLIDNDAFNKVGFFQPSWAIGVLTISPNCDFIASDSGSSVKITDANKPYDISKMKGVYNGNTWKRMEGVISKTSKVSHAMVTDIIFISDSEIISGSSKGEIILSKINGDMSLSNITSVNIGSEINSLAVSKMNKLLLVGTGDRILFLDIPSLKQKLIQNQGAIKILVSNDEKVFYYQTKNNVNKGTLEIDWDLINEYYQLLSKGVI